ncbi:MAG: transcriptional regulator [Pyrinomonadaceae bacterium]
MNARSPLVYEFDDFQLDADNLALYHRGRLIEEDSKKMLEVLSVLLRNQNKLVSYNEIIDEVWGDETFGVYPDRINQYVSQLRRVLVQYEPDLIYFKNRKGRGYIFTGEVSKVEEENVGHKAEVTGAPVGESLGQTDHLTEKVPSAPPLAETDDGSEKASTAARRFKYVYFLIGATLVFLAITYWTMYRQNDEEEVRRVVRESQMFETLVLYKQPERFLESDLDKYWTAELQTGGNSDRVRIRATVQKLLAESRQYGNESKNVQFRFEAVNITESGEEATVRTFEEWQTANYLTDGSLIKISPIGPYFVDYLLRKVDGRWLVEKSTTARTVRPTPRLDTIAIFTPPVAGKEFHIDLTGADIEPMTIYLEITGTGCPKVKPCPITNDILLKYAPPTETGLQRVPLTLASGEFEIVARNGDSKPSNSLKLSVP